MRASRSPYTIVRPGWFDNVSAGDQRLVFAQGDTGNGGMGRDQLADVLVRSLLRDTAVGRTFELFAEPGEAPTNWDDLFAEVTPDRCGALDGAVDPCPSARPSPIASCVMRLSGAAPCQCHSPGGRQTVFPGSQGDDLAAAAGSGSVGSVDPALRRLGEGRGR